MIGWPRRRSEVGPKMWDRIQELPLQQPGERVFTFTFICYTNFWVMWSMGVEHVYISESLQGVKISEIFRVYTYSVQ